MDKKILFLFIFGVSVFAVIIFSINMTIKKYGAGPLMLKQPKAEAVNTGAVPENNKAPSNEEPEREPAQNPGPLLY